jgi:hypothetical protein
MSCFKLLHFTEATLGCGSVARYLSGMIAMFVFAALQIAVGCFQICGGYNHLHHPGYWHASPSSKTYNFLSIFR